METSSQEYNIRRVCGPVDLENGPGHNRGVDVTEVKLTAWNLQTTNHFAQLYKCQVCYFAFSS